MVNFMFILSMWNGSHNPAAEFDLLESRTGTAAWVHGMVLHSSRVANQSAISKVATSLAERITFCGVGDKNFVGKDLQMYE